MDIAGDTLTALLALARGTTSSRPHALQVLWELLADMRGAPSSHLPPSGPPSADVVRRYIQLDASLRGTPGQLLRCRSQPSTSPAASGRLH